MRGKVGLLFIIFVLLIRRTAVSSIRLTILCRLLFAFIVHCLTWLCRTSFRIIYTLWLSEYAHRRNRTAIIYDFCNNFDLYLEWYLRKRVTHAYRSSDLYLNLEWVRERVATPTRSNLNWHKIQKLFFLARNNNKIKPSYLNADVAVNGQDRIYAYHIKEKHFKRVINDTYCLIEKFYFEYLYWYYFLWLLLFFIYIYILLYLFIYYYYCPFYLSYLYYMYGG